MVIGYARVSTEQQGTEAQLPELRKAGCRRIYQETMGGGTMDRRERTMVGLSSARARGRLGGRKKVLNPQQTRVVKTMWDSREHTRHDIAAHFTVSVATIDRILKASRSLPASRGGN